MNSFRRAPWYVKVLLLLLPVIALLRLYPTARDVKALLALQAGTGPIVLAVMAELLVLIYIWVVAWLIWHPKPFVRWLVLGLFGFVIANAVWYELHPGPSTVQLPRIGADESRLGHQAGTVISQVLALWWAYMCVFGRRSVQFFQGAAAQGRARV